MHLLSLVLLLFRLRRGRASGGRMTCTHKCYKDVILVTHPALGAVTGRKSGDFKYLDAGTNKQLHTIGGMVIIGINYSTYTRLNN